MTQQIDQERLKAREAYFTFWEKAKKPLFFQEQPQENLSIEPPLKKTIATSEKSTTSNSSILTPEKENLSIEPPSEKAIVAIAIANEKSSILNPKQKGTITTYQKKNQEYYRFSFYEKGKKKHIHIGNINCATANKIVQKITTLQKTEKLNVILSEIFKIKK